MHKLLFNELTIITCTLDEFANVNSLVICWLQQIMHEKEEKNQLWTAMSQNQNLKNCSVICYAMHSHNYDEFVSKYAMVM